MLYLFVFTMFFLFSLLFSCRFIIVDHVLDRFVSSGTRKQVCTFRRRSEDSMLQRAADFMHLASNRFSDLFRMEL